MKKGLIPAALVTIVVARAGIAADAAPGPMRTINDGVFTSVQAQRGRLEYLKNCSVGCHNAELTGNARAPVLAGDSFLQRWRGQTLDELFRRIQSTMPQTKPQSLSDSTYIDIIAYLLDANGLPSGNVELQADPKTLTKVGM